MQRQKKQVDTCFSVTVHAGFEPAISSVTGRRDRPLLQWTKYSVLPSGNDPYGI